MGKEMICMDALHQKGFFMKNRMAKIVVGILAAATVLTGAPALGNTTGFTVEAQAATTEVNQYVDSLYDGMGYIVGKGKEYGTMIMNPKKGATYSVVSKSKGLKFTKVKYSISEDVGYVKFNIEAKKAGKYKYAFTETTNGKTRTLENETLVVKNVNANKETITEKKGRTLSAINFLKEDDSIHGASAENWDWKIIKGNGKVIKVKEKGPFGDIKTVGKGTAKIQVLDYYGRSRGIVTIKVK